MNIKQYFQIIIGSIHFLFYWVSIIFWSSLLFLTALLKFLIPIPKWKKFCAKIIPVLPELWITTNTVISEWLIPMNWNVQGLDQVRRNEWYLLLANHQSWSDIIILQIIFNRKIPMPKFFMKKELLWSLPFASWACWILDFPFMARHTKKEIAKNPQLKGKDIASARAACEKFRDEPTTVAIFLEGTRFTEEKKILQKSPYNYLLKPKAGGVAFALATLGDYFHTLLNVTIIYPTESANLWDFLCGRYEKITVIIETIPIDQELLGDYENDREFRKTLQKSLNELWLNKDKLIGQYRASYDK